MKLLNPKTGAVIQSIEGLDVPVSPTVFDGSYALVLHGLSFLVLLNMDASFHKTLRDDFAAPTHVVAYENGLLVSDYTRGELIKVTASGDTTVVVDGLTALEGLALLGETIFVF